MPKGLWTTTVQRILSPPESNVTFQEIAVWANKTYFEKDIWKNMVIHFRWNFLSSISDGTLLLISTIRMFKIKRKTASMESGTSSACEFTLKTWKKMKQTKKAHCCPLMTFFSCEVVIPSWNVNGPLNSTHLMFQPLWPSSPWDTSCFCCYISAPESAELAQRILQPLLQGTRGRLRQCLRPALTAKTT